MPLPVGSSVGGGGGLVGPFWARSSCVRLAPPADGSDAGEFDCAASWGGWASKLFITFRITTRSTTGGRERSGAGAGAGAAVVPFTCSGFSVMGAGGGGVGATGVGMLR